ncbi:NLRC3 [Symbiodinium necroappetens]|uniref:NLRC3 protein n=1 Tax=Symbiodinium necroappetens TaxID=1628268 RepID=A0A812XU63_9DINO|nr:NLRC3 [Symbiodinium necroappetens]
MGTRLVYLGAEALDIALSALEHYPVLESLEIVNCELRPKLQLLLKALEKIKLRQLHLQQNELFEEGTRQFIEALKSNGTLAALSLAHDHVDVAGVKALAEALRTNSALIELNLSYISLTSDDIIALAEAIKQNRTLKQLSLAGNNIGEELAFTLLEVLQTSGVERLDLTGCGWGDLGTADMALARAVRTGQVTNVTHPAVEFLCMLEDEKLKELEEAQKLVLDLDGRGLSSREAPGDDGAGALAAGFGQQKELERLTLNLHYNSLGEEGGKAVASALARLTELKELTLGLNSSKIRDAGAAAVAESLRNLRQLTKLNVGLYTNELGDPSLGSLFSVKPIPTFYRKSRALPPFAVPRDFFQLRGQLEAALEQSLLLGENKIGDAGAAAVAESLHNLPQLTWLRIDLHNNALGDAGATAVVESLRELLQLTELVVRLYANALREEEKEKLRATFDALPVRAKHICLDFGDDFGDDCLSLGALVVDLLPPKKQRSRCGGVRAFKLVAVALQSCFGVGLGSLLVWDL